MTLFAISFSEMGLTPILIGVIVSLTVLFFISFGISSAYMSKDSINESDPQRLRAKAKLAKKIAADAEMQKRLGRMDVD